ncbi:MAG: protein-L-isoaspartate(D-aspartate) O-methyltransferase [Elusimicrobia bacterium]|nr:protein-L-isoaspartate(D-aspartate) O-methyltransferase [Elusimicrobiota bacterium]
MAWVPYEYHKYVNKDSIDYKAERDWMIKKQLERRGIESPALLDAVRQIPRELFVPEEYRKDAYRDSPLPIGEGQTISQPYMTVWMTDILSPQSGEKILEIGTGSGYQTALLAYLGAKVYTIERKTLLLERARSIHLKLGLKNIYYKLGDGSLGWPEESLFDGIMVTAAAPATPDELVKELKLGGRMLLPEGSRDIQELTLLKKHLDGSLERTNFGGCRFVPLLGADGFDPEFF